MTPREHIVRVLSHLLVSGESSTARIRHALGGAVSKNAIRGDLEILHELGLVTPLGEGRERHWVADPGFVSRTVGPVDQISMLLGRQLSSFLEGTDIFDSLQRMEPKWSSHFPERLRPHLERKFRTCREPYRRYDGHREILNEVLDGLLRERRLALRYQRGDEPVFFEAFEPLTLALYRRAVYLLGRPAGGRRIERLAVDRIVSAEVTGDSFEYPEDWDPDAELKHDFGIHKAQDVSLVRLRFPAEKAHLVRARVWHPGQEILELEDGGVELRFLAGGRELVRFCLEWGGACEVVAPGWLRGAVIEELGAAVALYTPELSVAGGGSA